MPSIKPETAAPDTIGCTLLSCPTGNGYELFDAIPGPVLIVTPEGIIIDASLGRHQRCPQNKNRSSVGICKIIGSSPHSNVILTQGVHFSIPLK